MSSNTRPGGHEEALGSAAAAQAQATRLRAVFEGFSLTTSESRALVALLRLGSATPNQIARLSGISRPNLYPVLEGLRNRHLATKLAGRNSVWVAPDRDEVIARFERVEEERIGAAQTALADLRTSLDTIALPADQAGSTLEIIDEVTAGLRYEEMLPAVTQEILVFNRGPYAGERTVMAAVVDAAERGVRIRALWQEHEVCTSEGVISADAAGYARAGIDQRVVKSLPLLMALFDRSYALVAIPADDEGDVAYPVTVAVENRHFAEAMVGSFEQLWGSGEPLERFLPRSKRPKGRRPKASVRATVADAED